MSGIAGIIHFDGRPVEPGQVESMTQAMRYRGPDGMAHWRLGPVALGQCMLCTTPESLVEVQPLPNERGSAVLVMDGRVDNWLELRAELEARGATLRNRSDAELVLHAYETWGRDCPRHIDGDFAFVIWDARRQEAFCARDRMGNRPLNYHWNGTTLAFASDLHALFALPWIPQVLNVGYVAEHLSTEWLSVDETFWKGIVRLMPAHWMTAGPAGLSQRRYWEPELHAPLPFRRDEEFAEHYRGLLADVVRRMSRSHVDVACEVSGGLDSSAVFAVAEDLRHRQSLRAPGLRAFTLDFRGDEFADEDRHSDAVARHVGIALQRVAPARLPLSWYRDEASAFREFPGFPNWTMILPLYEAARAAGARAVLAGSGGDEWLGAAESWSMQVVRQRDMGELIHFLGTQDHGWPAALWQLVRHGLIPMLPGPAKSAVKAMLRPIQRPARAGHCDWLSAELAAALRQRAASAAALAPRGGTTAQKSQQALLHHPFVLFGREMSERQAARIGVERRLPFWSRQVVEAAFATPDAMRRRKGVDKWLHRSAMAGMLPPAVLQRADKADFFSVFREHRDELLHAMSRESMGWPMEWVDHSKLRRLLDRGLPPGGQIREDLGLWALFMLNAMH